MNDESEGEHERRRLSIRHSGLGWHRRRRRVRRIDAILLGVLGGIWLYLAMSALDAGLGEPAVGFVVGLLVFAGVLGLCRVRRTWAVIATWVSCGVAFWLFEELVTGWSGRWDARLFSAGLYMVISLVLATAHIVVAKVAQRKPPACRWCSYGGPVAAPGEPCLGCGGARPAPRQWVGQQRWRRWAPRARAAAVIVLVALFAGALWQGQRAR